MTWVVEKPIHAGGMTCAAIVETDVSVASGPAGIAALSEKRPVMVLVFEEEGPIGIDLRGRLHAPDDIERLYPQAIETARRHIAMMSD